jgi:hypothetical protein
MFPFSSCMFHSSWERLRSLLCLRSCFLFSLYNILRRCINVFFHGELYHINVIFSVFRCLLSLHLDFPLLAFFCWMPPCCVAVSSYGLTTQGNRIICCLFYLLLAVYISLRLFNCRMVRLRHRSVHLLLTDISLIFLPHPVHTMLAYCWNAIFSDFSLGTFKFSCAFSHRRKTEYRRAMSLKQATNNELKIKQLYYCT